MNEDEEIEGEEIEEMLEEEDDEEMELIEEQYATEEINNMQSLDDLNEKDFLFKDRLLYNKIEKEILELNNYLEESKNNFHKLFEQKDLESFENVIDYLNNISNKNKCVCVEVIKNLPAWKCVDCCQYESAIYCSECYKKSKDLHINHKIYCLCDSGGICDCGDPDSVSTFCPDHSGPYSNQDEINKYI